MLNLNSLNKSLNHIVYFLVSLFIVSCQPVRNHEGSILLWPLRHYEREEPNGNPLMEDRAATFRKQSIARAVPVVSQERAFRVKVLVALVAFCRFFTDMYRAACYDEVGQLQTLHHLPSTISDPVLYLLVLVITRCTPVFVDWSSFLSLEEALFLYLRPMVYVSDAFLREFTVLPVWLCNTQLVTLEHFLFLTMKECSLVILGDQAPCKVISLQINDHVAILQHLRRAGRTRIQPCESYARTRLISQSFILIRKPFKRVPTLLRKDPLRFRRLRLDGEGFILIRSKRQLACRERGS